MCPICGELEAGSGRILAPVALGGDCKGIVALLLDVNAGAIACRLTGFVGGSSRVRGLIFDCSSPAEATEHR